MRPIKGTYNKTISNFIGGESITKKIEKEVNFEKISIKKTIRRSFGTSDYYNFEKIQFDLSINNSKALKIRIRRKPFIKRIGVNLKNQYSFSGDEPLFLERITNLPELKFLLKHPKSELIIMGGFIIFKSEFIGMLNENLDAIYTSLTKLKEVIISK